MTVPESPAFDMSQVSEVLESAHAILKRTRDADLSQKVVNLRTYLALNRVYPLAGIMN
jgi:hypothetical protein